MSTLTPTFVSSAEAAFIAGVTDRQVHRVIDEHLVPPALYATGPSRQVSRLGAVFISFYVKTEQLYTSELRRKVVGTITERLAGSADWQSALDLNMADTALQDQTWLVLTWQRSAGLTLDLTSFFRDASARAREVDQALQRIGADPEVMGGVPVFQGTRVPVDTVLASLDAGVELSRLRLSYPFLNAALVDAARVYAAVRPRRGRPRRPTEIPSGWKLNNSKLVHPASS